MKSIQTFLVGLITIFLLQTCYKIDDYEPPIIQVILPESGAKLIDSLEVICLATDDGEVEYVEMWIDGEYDDRAEDVPYSFMLYAEDFEDKSNHVITARAYDDDSDYADSEPVYFCVYYPNQDTLVTDTTNEQTIDKGDFIYMGSSNQTIYRYDIKTSKLTRLVEDYRASHPVYMKDINKIGYRSHGSYHLSMMDLDGSNQQIIFDLPTMCVSLSYCAKNEVFYSHCHSDHRDIVSIDVEMDIFENITNSGNFNDARPFVSSSGDRLLYQSDSIGFYQIFENNLNTSIIRKIDIDNNGLEQTIPKWSNVKNGFYYREKNDNNEYSLKYFNFDSKTSQLIFNAGYSFYYDFSPDENFFAITLNKNGSENLYIYDIQNDNLEQKTFVDFRLYDIIWVSIE